MGLLTGLQAPYPIVDCEKMSEAGLTCNSVIMSVMEPPGNNVRAISLLAHDEFLFFCLL